MSSRTVIAILALGLLLAFGLSMCARVPPPTTPGAPPPIDANPPPYEPPEPLPSAPGPAAAADCGRPGPYSAAAARNAEAQDSLSWSPFGRIELGWRTYAPAIAAAVDTACGAAEPGFAEALARWEGRNGLPADGVVDPADFAAIKTAAHGRRPFVSTRGRGVCPDPPAPTRLVTAGPTEGYRGKAVQMRPAVLAAWREMVRAAKREDPRIAADPEMLTIFSAFRDPASDALRCAREGNCDGIRRATCSPHRTGLALDLVVGAAPGFTVDSTADHNRLFMTQTPAYRWLIRNASRFGFEPYLFEPWHWEYVREPV